MSLTRMPSRKPGSRYSDEEIERGLHVLALFGGNTRRASRELEQLGTAIPRDTLQAWKRDRAERYTEIRDRVVPQIRAKMAEESEDLARSYAAAERRTIRHYLKNLSDLRPAEAASSLRNLTTSRGISTDKASALRGLPTEITEHRSVDEILRKWERKGFIESTATEVDGEEVGEVAPLPVGRDAICPIDRCTESGIRGQSCPTHGRPFYTPDDPAAA